MMPEEIIEKHIEETLAGNARKNALDFIAFLRANYTARLCASPTPMPKQLSA